MTRLAVIVALTSAVAGAQNPDSLRKALLLYAPFDGHADAQYARGDARIYSAQDYKSLAQMQHGLEAAEGLLARGRRRSTLRHRCA